MGGGGEKCDKCARNVQLDLPIPEKLHFLNASI